MIVIDNILISDEVISEQFVCDLSKCKGGCCEDGDAGAPLEDKELKELENNYEVVKPYMTKSGIAEIEKQGLYVHDRYFGWVTPTIDNKICAYGYRDEKGIIKCAIEQAYNDGKLGWKKPISCHLFPIKIQQSQIDEDLEYVNYEPREDLCASACKLGKSLKVPAYQFLKEAIVRKYGEAFYESLDATAEHLKNS
ncbi:hypothetical protein A9P82_05235 [Arachidicoccus ginsenosidimutans]|uniref:DUF3109 family protein n=1 Tax=Arachidicoccus sp. BS20 TaxID=1850526 RepID=UPI0007F0F61B|nr:DUF3109 family protein [Arachidicoccus sp. BS20]ANI88739.1 hypothetical protein A9P82_05235 [Arachidicoccus sp. BS20]